MSDETQEIVTYGDLHADVSSFLLHLQRTKMIINSADPNIVSRLVNLITLDPSIEDILLFQELLNTLEFKKNVFYRFLGDVLADRGPNDIFTILVIKKLQSENLIHSWILSNHDAEAAYMFHTNNYRFEKDRSWHFNSFRTFLTTIQKIKTDGKHGELISNILDTLESIFIPIKLLDLADVFNGCSKNKTYLYSHAPITKKTITTIIHAAQANGLSPPCKPTHVFSNKQNLVKTVDFINQLLEKTDDKLALIASKIHMLEENKSTSGPDILPLLFRRDDEDPDTSYDLKCDDGTLIVNIHGHDGFSCDAFHTGKLALLRTSLNTIPLPETHSCWKLNTKGQNNLLTYTNQFSLNISITNLTTTTYLSKVLLGSNLLYQTILSDIEFNSLSENFHHHNTIGTFRYFFTIASLDCKEKPLLKNALVDCHCIHVQDSTAIFTPQFYSITETTPLLSHHVTSLPLPTHHEQPFLAKLSPLNFFKLASP